MSTSNPRASEHALFRYLEPEEVTQLLDRCPVREVESGELVLHAGDQGDRMYLLESGRVEVIDDRAAEHIVLARIGAGSFFGEIALLDGRRRTKDVRAVTPCRIRELRRADLLAVYDENPTLFAKISRALNEVLSTRLRDTLDDESPLIQYIRKLERTNPPTPRIEPTARAVVDPGRARLDRLYRAIRATKKALFEIAEGPDAADAERLLQTRGGEAVAELDRLMGEVREVLGDSPDNDQLGQAKRLFFQEMYPCLMRSSIIDLAYLKPRGFSLDHLVIDRICLDEPQGDDALGVLVDRFALDQPFLAGLRRRVRDAASFLREEVARRAGDEPVRVTCVGAGPAREALDLLSSPEGKGRAQVICIDADDQALTFIGERAREMGVRDSLRLLQMDLVELASRPDALQGDNADIVYGLTLLDRLDDGAAEGLLASAHIGLAPGGILYLVASSREDGSRLFCEFVLEWFLQRRRRTDLRALAAESLFPDAACRVEEDAEGVNLILRATRE